MSVFKEQAAYVVITGTQVKMKNTWSSPKFKEDESYTETSYTEENIYTLSGSSFTFKYGTTKTDGKYSETTKTITNCNTTEQSFQLDYIDPQHYDYSSDFLRIKNVTVTYVAQEVTKSFTPIGTSSNPFKGRFDGQGYTIKNLNINLPTQNNIGLFGIVEYVSNNGNSNITDISSSYFASIEGICLENATIIGYDYVGGIVGEFMKGQYVKNCCIKDSKIEGNNTVGGIVGEVQDWNMFNNDNLKIDGEEFGKYPKILNCYIINDVSESTTNYVKGNQNIGGITGVSRAVINNCYVMTQLRSDNPNTTVGAIDGNNGNAMTATKEKSGDSYYTDAVGMMLEGQTKINYSNNAGKDKGVQKTEDEIKTMSYESGTLYNDDYGVNDGWPMTEAQYKNLVGTTEIELVVMRWNLFGSTKEENVNRLNIQDGSECDMAAISYDYSANDWSENYLAVKNDDTFKLGHGYFVWPFDKKQDLSASGKTEGDKIKIHLPNNSLTSVTFEETNNGTKKADENGVNSGVWFAMSNPFISGSVQFSAEDKAKLQGGWVYIWDASQQQWTDKSLTEGASIVDVPAGYGFMVASANDAKTLSVTMTKGSSSAKKKDVKTTNLIQFTSFANDMSSIAYAISNKQASDGFDIFDAYKMFATNENIVEPYFVVDNRNMVKNEFKSLPYEDSINFHAQKVSNVKFTVNNVPDDMEVFIKDLSNNQETLISDGTVFEFTANEGENEGRFIIKFVAKNLAVENAIENNDIVINNNNRTLNISGKDLRQVDIFNVLGQTVQTKQISGDYVSFDINAISGAYIIKVQTANGNSQKKIVIK